MPEHARRLLRKDRTRVANAIFPSLQVPKSCIYKECYTLKTNWTPVVDLQTAHSAERNRQNGKTSDVSNLKTFACRASYDCTCTLPHMKWVSTMLIKWILIIRYHGCQERVLHPQRQLAPLKLQFRTRDHPVSRCVLWSPQHLCCVHKLEQLWCLHRHRWTAGVHSRVDVHISWARGRLLSRCGEMCANECRDEPWLLA